MVQRESHLMGHNQPVLLKKIKISKNKVDKKVNFLYIIIET
jgi:hypothetical protein